MIHIFQIAGEPKYYQEKEFLIDGGSYRSCLSSDALKRHLERSGEKANLTLFVPESLLLKRSIDEFVQEMKDKGITDFEAVIIPSMGEFRSNGDKIRFVTGIESISTSIFIHLLKIRPEEIYADVSTGQNIYPVSMLEAVKRYLTYRKLEVLLQGEANVRAYTVFPPPVTGDVQTYPVEIQPVDVKAFFSLPKSDIDRLATSIPERLRVRVPEINRKYSDLKKEVRLLVRELKRAYHAIRLNVPLAFYQLVEMKAQTEEIERKVIDLIEELLKPVRTKKSVERLSIDGVNVSNIFYSTALYRSIQEFKKTLKEPEINEILEKFSSLYRLKNLGAGVNEYFLRRDIEDIRQNGEQLDEGEGKLYGVLKHGDQFTPSTVAKRNFFAHSGFLQEFTVLRKKNGKIYVRWLPEKIKEIQSWLEEPGKN